MNEVNKLFIEYHFQGLLHLASIITDVVSPFLSSECVKKEGYNQIETGIPDGADAMHMDISTEIIRKKDVISIPTPILKMAISSSLYDTYCNSENPKLEVGSVVSVSDITPYVYSNDGERVCFEIVDKLSVEISRHGYNSR